MWVPIEVQNRLYESFSSGLFKYQVKNYRLFGLRLKSNIYTTGANFMVLFVFSFI